MIRWSASNVQSKKVLNSDLTRDKLSKQLVIVATGCMKKLPFIPKDWVRIMTMGELGNLASCLGKHVPFVIVAVVILVKTMIFQSTPQKFGGFKVQVVKSEKSIITTKFQEHELDNEMSEKIRLDGWENNLRRLK
ncbi:hypothetical protein EVAR_99466_1 [Eumeta japonica]|uniref:Uncharacterized protein n=1 Tax=Eumeta variegata TaxID=151549 RepID=A0A4C1Z1K0_EUMVA|nr:hypothetical protein EVAR_99466_1 [Eumeta japonica]